MESDSRGSESPLPEAALAALARGNKIEAIKIVRIAHGVGLKEAKDAVDRYQESLPGPLRTVPGSDSGLGRLLGFALLALVLAAVFYLLG